MALALHRRAAQAVLQRCPSLARALAQASQQNQLDSRLVEALCCPLSKGPLRYSPETSELISEEINVAFPVVHGIPQLVPSLGRVLGPPPGDLQPVNSEMPS